MPFGDRLARASQARPPRHRLRGPCHRRGTIADHPCSACASLFVARSLLTAASCRSSAGILPTARARLLLGRLLAASCRKFGWHPARRSRLLEKSNNSDWTWSTLFFDQATFVRRLQLENPTCCDWSLSIVRFGNLVRDRRCLSKVKVRLRRCFFIILLKRHTAASCRRLRLHPAIASRFAPVCADETAGILPADAL